MHSASSTKRYAFKSRLKRAAVYFFDLTGGLLWALFGLRRKITSAADIKKILVMRIDPLGDLIMTRPALHALKQAYPHAQIDLLVSEEIAPLLEDSREVRNILGMKTHWFKPKKKFAEIFAEKKRLKEMIRREKYDIAIDFRGDLRNILFLKCSGIKHVLGYGITGGGFLLSGTEKYGWDSHQVLVNLKLLNQLGIQTLPRVYPFTYSAARKERFWKTLGSDLNPNAKFRVTFHTGAGLQSKCWPQDSFREVLNQTLALPGAEAVVIGTAAEKELLAVDLTDPRLRDFRGKTDLGDLPILFDACHLHVGNDSGPGHLAAAQGISVVSLFSGTNAPEVWKPWGARTLDLFAFSAPADVTPAQVFEKIHNVYRKCVHAG